MNKRVKALMITIEITGAALLYALGGRWYATIIHAAILTQDIVVWIAELVVLFEPTADSGDISYP